MSPRDRKRDRVLKRRRETKRKERRTDRDDDENDDTLERMYFAAREKQDEEEGRMIKKPKSSTAQESNPDASATDSPSCETRAGVADSSTANEATQRDNEKPINDTTTPLTKEERQRLKNQQRKALRKEKKARRQQVEQEIVDQKKKEQAKAESLALQHKQERTKKEQQAAHADFQSMHLGVRYKDITVGKGPAVQDSKNVRVSYKLRAQHNRGKVIDSSPDFRFRVGKGEVVKGWDIGLLGMRQDGIRHLIVPPQAGYGRKNVGAGPGGLLYFEITLISC